MSDRPEHECFLCKKQTESLAGDPLRWPTLLPYPGGNGNMREYHIGCVSKILAEHAARSASPTPKTHAEVAKANAAEDLLVTGPIAHTEARECLQRFIHSHFDRGGEKARITIPADAMRDDDIRLGAYIEQHEQREKELRAAGYIDPAGNVRRVLEWSHNPLTNRIHAEIEAAQGGGK